MIDSIGIYGRASQVELNRLLLKINDKGGLIEHRDRNENNFLPLKSFRIRPYGEFIYLTGSLSQQYYESNQSMKWFDVENAIEKLEDILQFKLDEFKLNRVDVESTFPLNRTPKTYFDFLGNSPSMYRNQSLNSLTYNNKSRKFCFYDKKKQMSERYGIMSDSALELMRFETSYKKGYIAQMRKNKAFDNSLKSLKSSFTQRLLTNKWFEDYRSIRLNPKPSFIPDQLNNKRDLRNALESRAIEAFGGVVAVEEMIDRARTLNPNLSPNVIYNMKQVARNAGLNKNYSNDCQQIMELDVAIITEYWSNLLLINESN